MTVSRTLFLSVLTLLAACQPTYTFEPDHVAQGPGGMVGNGDPITSGTFAGGDDTLPAARAVGSLPNETRPPDCDADCVAYCNGAGLQNPVNRGLCRSLWGVGLSNRPILHAEACRRLFVDMLGRVPGADEAEATCVDGWGATVKRLMEMDEFILIQQRRAADRFLYSNEVTSIQAIYDMDRLVEKLYRGKVPYDLFAAVVSAHPVLTRRYADPGDKAEALFTHFLGRPPFEHERADMSRLYKLWHSGYYDHPQMGLRLPDAFIRFRCLDDNGQVDEVSRGECASVLWGYNELIFTPDLRASRDPGLRETTMWSGLLKPEEWAKLQTPGRILSRDMAFWERAVDEVLVQYLGYELSASVPEVREELVRWLLENDGDIRSVHYAVATSAAYLQSAEGASASAYRWTYGPLKQVNAEVWIDSMARNTGFELPGCDHRISQPEALLDSGSVASFSLLQESRWQLDKEGELDERYSDLARTLGGCPENVSGGRFRVVSILTTATQLSFVQELCNPTLDPRVKGAAVEKLLPEGVSPSRAVDPDLAEQIATHQYRLLLGRTPDATEKAEAREAGTACAQTLCKAEEFARPYCFALLGSAERVFY
ncbi:hypothetical protein [Archangium violaceum]|uniref:DUF1549 domain-containing protein n=1 Tax=Archangium violaceum Cb vi76 TaxID=1406225 RepID=A0A084SE59_9BACT|nr:hypothetical protein [Archangium violaceum]KFA86744.1 hypothetical protein Q664_52335 [Archangium violaceum Cb vi76]